MSPIWGTPVSPVSNAISLQPPGYVIKQGQLYNYEVQHGLDLTLQREQFVTSPLRPICLHFPNGLLNA